MSTRYRVAGLLLSVAIACAFTASVVNRVNDSVAEARENREAQSRRQERSLWQDSLAKVAVRAMGTRDTVVRLIRQVSITRDTLLLHLTDTERVKEYVYQTDTLRVQCGRCAARLDSLRVASDGTITAISGERDYYHRLADQREPHFRDRLGCFAGYGASGGQDHQARIGFAIACGARIFP